MYQLVKMFHFYYQNQRRILKLKLKRQGNYKKEFLQWIQKSGENMKPNKKRKKDLSKT
jgi:hypothetical protein